jgi:phosphoglycolate phosphatase-like HAD superfamily hydrolase
VSSVLYLFDIDGTLMHAAGSGRAAFDAVFAELHAIPNASEGVRFGGKTDPAIVEEIYAARLGRAPTAEEHAAFLDAYLPRLHQLLVDGGVQVLDGVVDALAYLKARPSVVLGVATGNVRAGADAKLAAAGLSHWFELGGFGCDSHLRAELVARAIERGRARGDVREVVVVGDTIHDIAAARACGATVCAVATGADPAEALADADAVFASMIELPAWHARRFDGPATASGERTARPDR